MDIEKATVAVEGQRWEKELPELGDLEVLVSPWENKAFERVLQKQIGQLPPGLRPDGKVDPSAYYRCVGIAIARTIIFDWRNFKLGGADKPFDAKYAESLLINPEYRPFRDGVAAASRRVQQNLKLEEEELVGKLPTSSPGSETGDAALTK